MTPERILIACCEPKMSHLLRQLLAGDGYGTIVAARGEQTVQMAAMEQPALVMLDVVLTGDVDGFEAVRRIREFSEVPIILLSERSETQDALRGYSLGADDFVIKPFDPKILLARIRVLLKRCQSWTKVPAEIICSD